LKKAFTLIEVMVSTFILFIVVFAVMNSISNTHHLFKIFESHKQFNLVSSVAFLENKKAVNLYEKLVDFNIKNDEIIHSLKKYNIYLNKKIDYENDYNFSNFHFTEIIYKVKAYDKHHSSYVYELGVK
jgi:predicted regulator of amino acid metabolism with ACT domain